MSDSWATITPNKGEEEEKLEIEIEGQEEEQLPLDLEVEEPKVKAVKETTEEEEEKPEEESALEGVETSGAQKRIRQLVQQKKEREAEIEKLLEQNKQMQLTLQAQQDQYRNALESNISNSELQLKERLVIAKDSYRRALDSGDADAIVQAQEYLNSTQLETARLEDYKKNYAAMSPAQKEAVAEQAAQQTQQPETYNGYNMKAYQWAAANEWFNQDPILTNAALIIDGQLKEEGYDPNDDDFYEEVNKRLADNFPNKFGKPVTQESEVPRPKAASTPSQVVAGASLAPKTSSGRKVKLTQEDVRLAQKWGISLEQYAAEKLKIENSEEGSYTTIN